MLDTVAKFKAKAPSVAGGHSSVAGNALLIRLSMEDVVASADALEEAIRGHIDALPRNHDTATKVEQPQQPQTLQDKEMLDHSAVLYMHTPVGAFRLEEKRDALQQEGEAWLVAHRTDRGESEARKPGSAENNKNEDGPIDALLKRQSSRSRPNSIVSRLTRMTSKGSAAQAHALKAAVASSGCRSNGSAKPAVPSAALLRTSIDGELPHKQIPESGTDVASAAMRGVSAAKGADRLDSLGPAQAVLLIENRSNGPSIMLDDLKAAFQRASELWLDLDDQTFFDLPTLLRLLLWYELGKPPPVVLSGTLTPGMLEAAVALCEKRDHLLWIDQQLCRLDACGCGDEMRTLLAEAARTMQMDLYNKQYTLSVIKALSQGLFAVYENRTEKLQRELGTVPWKKHLTWFKLGKKVTERLL